MEEKTTASRSFDVHDEIVADHHELKQLLPRIEECSDISDLLALLRQLHTLLVRHFKAEESPAGLHQIIGDAAPQYGNYLQRLFEEHEALDRRIEALIDRAQALLEGPVAEVRIEVAGLCTSLREHESTETRLLTDALYTDLGEGGQG